MNNIDEAIESLRRITIDLLKESLEGINGDYLGDTNNKIEYQNYLIDDPIIFGLNTGIDMGDISDVGIMISSKETKANAEIVINTLMKNLGLTRQQAAGIAGVMTAESGINPHIFNKGEKYGNYKSSKANNEGTPYGTNHCPWSYGAGICQWTFTQRKESAIMGGLKISRDEAIQIIKNGGIESLSLENQIKMLQYELNTLYKYTLQGIKKCVTAEQAAATFYCHAIAGYSTSTEPATQSEINSKNIIYSKVGVNSQINKGMAYAKSYIS